MIYRVLTSLVLCCAATSVCAETAITIKETQALTFPTAALPSMGTTFLSINPLNSATSGSGQIVAGMANHGTYALSSSGSDAVSISINISGINTGHTGLTLDHFRGFYGGQSIDAFPSSTLPLPAAQPASTPLYIGATVTANTSVPEGRYSGAFAITVFVQ